MPRVPVDAAKFVSALFLKPASGFSYYHTDAIGSVRAITDSAGTPLARHDYAPFGEDTQPLTGDPLRFAGKELDAETALHYFEARYYRQTWGRFSQVDPVSGWVTDPQSWNRYAYARNNPLKYVDPTGLSYWTCTDGCSWVDLDYESFMNQMESWGQHVYGDRTGGALYDDFGRHGSYQYYCLVVCDQGRNGQDGPAITEPLDPGGGSGGDHGDNGDGGDGCPAFVPVTCSGGNDDGAPGPTAGGDPSTGEEPQDPRLVLGPIVYAATRLFEALRPYGTGITVLGHYDEYVTLGQSMGARIFNLHPALYATLHRAGLSWEANRAFLDAAFVRGDRIILTVSKMDVRPGSTLQQEIEYLLLRGYQWGADLMSLVPPGR